MLKARLLLASILSICISGAAHASSEAAPDISIQGADVLFWSQAQRLSGFPAMDTLFPAHVVEPSGQVRPLDVGPPLQPFAEGGQWASELDSFISDQHVAGLLVLHEGRIRLERYALGYSSSGRWTSFSVAKSITSTLVGAAIRDGHIKSVDELLTSYLPELIGSAYEGVSIRQLLTMTSGVAFNEDYADPDSDIARLYRTIAPPGVDATVNYVRSLPREAPPGAKWRYKTPETNLVGLLVMAATGRSLADYLSEKIWRPYGMAHEATWIVDGIGNEQGGCCLQASLQDFARFGQFVLEGAEVNGVSVVPEGWVQEATTTQVEIGAPGMGYGFQWWTLDDGSTQAIGIFGQLIHIDPSRGLVVVLSSAWPEASSRERSAARRNFLTKITGAIDAEGQL